VDPGAPAVVGDLDADAGPERCAHRSVFAGAALVVTYEDPALAWRTVVVHEGLARVGDATPAFDVLVPAADLPAVPGAATLTALVWEGDGFGTGEHLRAGGVDLPGDAAPGADGARWDGEADPPTDPPRPTPGVDVERAALPTPPPAGQPLTLGATSGADQVLVGLFALVVDDAGRAPAPVDDALELATTDPVALDVVADDVAPDRPGDPHALDTAAVSIVAWPEVVTATVDGHSVVVQAPPGFEGDDAVGYELCDAAGRCGRAVLHVHADVPDPAPPVTRHALAGEPVPVDAVALEGALDLDRLAVTIPPAHGTVTVARDAGLVVYTPAPGAPSPDAFAYQACRPRGSCRTRTVVVVPGA
jgi:hypothetical protein